MATYAAEQTESSATEAETVQLRKRDVEVELEQARFELASLQARHMAKMATRKDVECVNSTLQQKNDALLAAQGPSDKTEDVATLAAARPDDNLKGGSRTALPNEEIVLLREKLASAEKELAAFRTVCHVDSSIPRLQRNAAEPEGFTEVDGRMRGWEAVRCCNNGLGGKAGEQLFAAAAVGERLEQARVTRSECGSSTISPSPSGSWGDADSPAAQSSGVSSSPRDRVMADSGGSSPGPTGSLDHDADQQPLLIRVFRRFSLGGAHFAPAEEDRHRGMANEKLLEDVRKENVRLSVELAAVKAELESAGGGLSCENCQCAPRDCWRVQGSKAQSVESDLPLLLDESREELDRVGEHLLDLCEKEQRGPEMSQALQLRDLMETLRDVRECVLVHLESLKVALGKIKEERAKHVWTAETGAHRNPGEGIKQGAAEKEAVLEEFTAEAADTKEEHGRMLTAEEVVAEQAMEIAALKELAHSLQYRLEAKQRIIDGHVASMAEMREEVEAVKEERESKLAALKASVLEIVKLNDQVEQLREAEVLLGHKLKESLDEAGQLRADLLEAKGAALGAQEDLEATKRRSEDIRASVVQLMDRMALQQCDIDNGREECEQALQETERVLAELGQRDLVIENLTKSQIELEDQLDATRTQLAEVLLTKEGLQQQLSVESAQRQKAEEELLREKEALEKKREEWTSGAAVVDKEGSDFRAMEEELRMEKDWSVSLEARCNSLERQCEAARAELESTRTKAAEDKAAAADEGRLEALATRLQETEKTLWRARLEEERAKEDVESLKASCARLDAELSAKTSELAKMQRWPRQASAGGSSVSAPLPLHRPSHSFMDPSSSSAPNTPLSGSRVRPELSSAESTTAKESAEGEDLERQLGEAQGLVARSGEERTAFQQMVEEAEGEAEEGAQESRAARERERKAEERVQVLESELATVQRELEEAVQCKAKLEQRGLELEQAAEALQENLKKAKSETAAARNSLASLGVAHAEAMEAARKDRKEGKKTMSRLTAEKGFLEEEAGRLKQECADLQSTVLFLNKDLSQCKEGLGALEAELAEKEKLLQEVEEHRQGLQQQVEAQEGQLAEMAQRARGLLDELEDMERAWAKERAALEAEVGRRTIAEKARQTEKDALSGKVRELELSAQEATALTARLEELERKLEEAQGERACARKAHETELEMLESSLALSHQQKLAELEAGLKASAAAAQEALQAKIAGLQSQVRSTVSSTGTDVELLGEKLERVARDRDELEVEVRSLEREKNTLAEEKQRLQGRVLELEGETKSKVEALTLGWCKDEARKLGKMERDLGAALAAKESAEALCRSQQQTEQALQSRLETAKKEAQEAQEEATLAWAEFMRIEAEQAMLAQLVEGLREREAYASALLQASRQQVCRVRTLAVAREWRIKALRSRSPTPAGAGSGGTPTVNEGALAACARVRVPGPREFQLLEDVAALERRTQDLSVELAASKEAEKEAARQIVVLARIKEALEGEVRKWRDEGSMRHREDKGSVARLGAFEGPRRAVLGPRTMSSTSLRDPGPCRPALARAVSTTSAGAGGEETLEPNAMDDDLMLSTVHLHMLVVPQSRFPEWGKGWSSSPLVHRSKSPERKASKGFPASSAQTSDTLTSVTPVPRSRMAEGGRLGAAHKRAKTPEKRALKKSAAGVVRGTNGEKGHAGGSIQAKQSGAFYRTRSTTASQAPVGALEVQAYTGAFSSMASTLRRGTETNARSARSSVPAKDPEAWSAADTLRGDCTAWPGGDCPIGRTARERPGGRAMRMGGFICTLGARGARASAGIIRDTWAYKRLNVVLTYFKYAFLTS